jgi:hypothetical protein
MGRHWKKKLLTTGNSNKVHPSSPHWKTNLRRWKKKLKNLYFEHFLQLKSLICTVFARFGNLNMQFAWDLKCFGLESLSFSCSCTTFAGCWNLNMQFAWYSKRFGLESLACTVLAASWSQHLYYAGDYLQYFVVFATYCLKLVLGSLSGWFRVLGGIISG